MRTFLTILAFVSSLIRNLFKWLTKGFYRIFRNACYDARDVWEANSKHAVDRVITGISGTPIFKGPSFVSLPSKRRRRGHRGGRKHRHNHGGHHHG